LASGGIAPFILTLALDGGEWSASHPRERAPGMYWIGGWVGPSAIWMWWWREKFPDPIRNTYKDNEFRELDIHSAKPLTPEPSFNNFEIVIQKLKHY